MAEKSIISKRFLYCLLLALVLLVLDHYSLYFPWILNSQEIIPQTTALKKRISPQDISKDFLLIDVSDDAGMYCDSPMVDKLGVPFDPGSPKMAPCYAGTDLDKLTRLFKWLAANQDRYKAIVCNIIFDNLEKSRESDSLLGYIINIVQKHPDKIMFSSVYDKENDRFHAAGFSTHLPSECKGAVNEELIDDHVFTYQLSYDNTRIRSLPLLMLEKIDTIKIEPGTFGFYQYKKRNSQSTASNLFIPEMLVLPQDIDSLKMPGNYDRALNDTIQGKIALWQALLQFDGTENYYLQEALKNGKRTLFIGSFSHEQPDMYKTLYGDMDGGIILLNVYYNLLKKENVPGVLYTIVTFAWLLVISWLALNPPRNTWHTRFVAPSIAIDLFFEELHYIVLFVMTACSIIVFDKVSNVIVLLTVIFMISKISKAYRRNEGRSRSLT